MNEKIRLGALTAALVLAPLAAGAQQDDGSGATSDAITSDAGPSVGSPASSDLQPTYTAVGTANSNKPAGVATGTGGGSGGTGGSSDGSGGNAGGSGGQTAAPSTGDRHGADTGSGDEHARHKVSEIRRAEERHEIRQGEREMRKGEIAEYRGERLVAEGEKEGGAQGAKLEAEGKSLERRGAHEVARGSHEVRRGSRVNRDDRARWEARREARRAARGGGQTGSRSRSAGAARSSARANDRWHHHD